MELTKDNRQSPSANDNVFVDVPQAHQGVSDALRAAFVPVDSQLPTEIEVLLEQIR